MFRPNRIGTPLIHTFGSGSSTRAGWLATTTIANQQYAINVINATPQLDFGANTLNWQGNEVVTASHKFAIGQQFTITKPIAGDTVGVELNAAIMLNCPAGSSVVSIFGRLAAAETVLLDPGALQDDPTIYGSPPQNFNNAAYRMHNNTNQIIVRDTGATLAGTYFHGFCILDTGAAGFNLTWFQASMSVRQLNDQQDIGYRDTRR